MDISYEKLLSDEDFATDFFKNLRIEEGIVCPRCKGVEHYYVQTIKQFTCKCCKRRTTLKSGTVMQSSKLPLKIWLQTFWFMAQSKKGISAKHMQRLLGIKRYRTVFELMHKIRNMMGQSEQERISQCAEGYVSVKLKLDIRDENSTKRQQLLLCNQKNQNGYYQISILSAADMNTWQPAKNARISMARTHKWTYSQMNSVERVRVCDLTVWELTHYSNLLKSITGVHHGVSKKYRQNYLDEFSFKTNTSMDKKDVFERIVKLSVLRPWWAQVT